MPVYGPTTNALSRSARVVALVAASLVGILAGLGVFTFAYADGSAYLGNDPAACANCHVMQAHYDSWQASSHRAVATCNDCHTPHNFVGKWLSKADNGFFHSLAFTTGDYPFPLQIKSRNIEVTQEACLYCHSQTVHEMLPVEAGGEIPQCVHCHFQVGHAHRARRGQRSNR